jgi:hypothetical protein
MNNHLSSNRRQAFAPVPENQKLKHYIITAGQQAGLFLNEERMQRIDEDDWPRRAWPLTAPVIFTLRPVDEYLNHYRGSWTDMWVAPQSVGEPGDEELGFGLVFEARFSLAYIEGQYSDVPGLVLDEILARLDDFIHSYPAEAALLFENSLSWEMSIDGEIIYVLEEDDRPVLDFGMYPTLGLNTLVYEVPTEAAFEQALATLDDDSALGRGIRDGLQRLALLFRWLDIEAPSIPPLSDMLGNDL